MAYRFLSRVHGEAELYRHRGKARGRYLLNTRVILITEGKHKGQFAVPKWSGETRKFQLLSSIYLFHRQVVDILNGYDQPYYGEKSVMRQAIEAAKELNLAVIGLNKGNLAGYEKALTERVDEIFRIVGRVRDETKENGLRVIEPIPLVHDSLGRINPGALRARSVAAGNRFGERLVTIEKIEEILMPRLLASKAVFDFAEYLLASSCHFLKAIVDFSEGRQYQVEERVRQRMVARLHSIIVDLEVINFQPFLANAELGTKELQKGADLILANRIEEAIVEISRAYNSLSLKKIQGEVEDLILEVTYVINTGLFVKASLIMKLREIAGQMILVEEKDFQKKCLDEAIKNARAAYLSLKAKEWEAAKKSLIGVSEAITWYDYS
ncbi:MAG: hypothetical protein WC528_05435 [Patescibacteria group bacterium]